MSECIMFGSIVKSDDGIIGIFYSTQDGKYVIKNRNLFYHVDRIKKASYVEMESYLKMMLR